MDTAVLFLRIVRGVVFILSGVTKLSGRKMRVDNLRYV